MLGTVLSLTLQELDHNDSDNIMVFGSDTEYCINLVMGNKQ